MHNSGRHCHRGEESTLTVRHVRHRPRIPFGHVRIERWCPTKHCKRGCNNEKKRPSHHKQQQKSTVSNTQTTKRTTRVRLVTRRTSSGRIYKYSTTHTTTEGAVATERGRESEYTYWHTYLSPPPYSSWTRLN